MHLRQKYGTISTRHYQLPTTPVWRCAPELGIIEERTVRQRITPDVTVVRHPRPAHEPDAGGLAVLTQSRREVSKFIEYEVLTDPIRHHFVEIQGPARKLTNSSHCYEIVSTFKQAGRSRPRSVRGVKQNRSLEWRR